MAHRYFVRGAEVPRYSPSEPHRHRNHRLIGPDTVGAQGIEVVLGVIERGQGALPHAHPGIEQVCYMLEGTAIAEVGGERCELGPGDACYFPARHDARLHGDEREACQAARRSTARRMTSRRTRSSGRG